MLITVEGIDGAGKSTLVAGLANALAAREPVVLREPGGVELSERLRALNAFGTAGIAPERTLLLRIEPAAGLARVGGRGEAQDRIEAEREAFWIACARAYDELAAAEPERWAVIDATQPPERVLAEALAQLAPVLEP